jgi:hypothetical protein
MSVDKEGYEQAMAEQKARSRGEGKDGGKQVFNTYHRTVGSRALPLHVLMDALLHAPCALRPRMQLSACFSRQDLLWHVFTFGWWLTHAGCARGRAN